MERLHCCPAPIQQPLSVEPMVFRGVPGQQGDERFPPPVETKGAGQDGLVNVEVVLRHCDKFMEQTSSALLPLQVLAASDSAISSQTLAPSSWTMGWNQQAAFLLITNTIIQ